MRIRQQRLDRGIRAMQEQNVDMWIAYGRDMQGHADPMLRYLLTFDMLGPVVIILAGDGRSIAINSALEIEEIQSMGVFTSVITNPNGADGIKQIVADTVREVQPKTIALNYSDKDSTSDGLSLTGYRLLTDAFAQAGFAGEVISSQSLMRVLRANRSPEEVARIRNAVQESMQIYAQARPQMRKGMSGMDIQRLFQSLTDVKGYGYSWPKYSNPFNSIGTRSSYLCKRPADDVYIEPGDVVNVDFGIIVDGFASDNQRTFYALRDGETAAPEEVQKAFDTLGQVNLALAQHMQTGVKSGDILAYANEIFVANGYPARNGGFGHEIGLVAHDGVLSPGSNRCEPEIDATFLAGMTFTLEPAILTSCGRVCREEVIAVTNEGGEILSTLQDAIWLIS
ncbi:MAG: M24 family metallopeptidase [Anaerolineae bacterium]